MDYTLGIQPTQQSHSQEERGDRSPVADEGHIHTEVTSHVGWGRAPPLGSTPAPFPPPLPPPGALPLPYSLLSSGALLPLQLAPQPPQLNWLASMASVTL